MATTTTFVTLQEDMRKYLERGAATDPEVYEQLPRLVNLAERRIATELKILGVSTVVTSAMVPGQSVYAKPDRWRDVISMNVGLGPTMSRRTPVLPRSYEYLRSYWPDEAEVAEPEFYADYGFSNWLIAPTPDAAYPFEISYYELPPLLDDDTQTNWLTEYAPQALLYGALLEASLFLKDDQRVGVWQPQYDRAAAMLNGEDLKRIFDRATTRKEA